MKFGDLPLPTRVAAGVLAGFAIFVIWDQHHWWKLRDEYAFGYIVPLFVGYVLFERWPLIYKGLAGTGEGVSPDGNWRAALRVLTVSGAIVALLGGLTLFLAGALYKTMEGTNLISSNLITYGYAAIVLSVAFLYFGVRKDGSAIPLPERWRLALLLLFPALIWILSVPMFSALQTSLSTFLMNKVAVVVYYLFDLLGYAVVREGSVLKLPEGDVGVEDACSGIRSLTACLFAGSFLGAVFFTSFWKKALLVATAMLFAFFNNILRSLFLTAWAYAKGPGGLDIDVIFFGFNFGNVHDVTGWIVLGLTVVCLLILVKILSIRFEYVIEPRSPA